MQTGDESELFKPTFEKQQHRCYFCGKELKESEAFGEKFVIHPSLSYPDMKIKPEDNYVILCNDCMVKRSWNDIYLKLPQTGKLINKKGNSVERKDMGGGVVLALLFGWLGLFYSNKTYALIGLFVWIGLIIGNSAYYSYMPVDSPLLIPLLVLILILDFSYIVACIVVAVKSIKKQHALYDECMKR